MKILRATSMNYNLYQFQTVHVELVEALSFLLERCAQKKSSPSTSSVRTVSLW
jgi:hypothetical protein